MNVCMENVVYCDQKGFQYKLDNYAIRFRQILYIQIPDSVRKYLKNIFVIVLKSFAARDL